MIVHGEGYDLVNAIETLLEDAPAGDIKPELMESVLEISTDPCRSTAEAGAQLRALRAQVRATAARSGLTIGSSGTHPFAMWEDQRIVGRDRYRDIISALRFVARQELIFGMHVHVGVDGPDKAIHVADGMRVHVPVLLALSCNSPFWRADVTGLHSTRTPIFRAFPRVGVPPAYGTWQNYADADRLHGPQRRDGGLHLPLVRRAAASAAGDRRDPRLRQPDADRAHARARRADPGDGQGAVRALRRRRGARPTTRGRCSTRTSGSPRGTGWTPRSSTCPGRAASRARDLAQRLLDRLRPHAEELGSAAELRGHRGPPATAGPVPSASARSTRPTTTCTRS